MADLMMMSRCARGVRGSISKIVWSNHCHPISDERMTGRNIRLEKSVLRSSTVGTALSFRACFLATS